MMRIYSARCILSCFGVRAIKLGVPFALVLSLVWTHSAYAGGPGDLDLSFNKTGIVTTSISSGGDFGYSIAVQPDGKLIVAGLSDNNPGGSTAFEADIAVVRYNIDGSLDASFNGSGIVTTSLGFGSGGGSQNAVAVQPDGKIVVAASVNNDSSFANSDFAVLRYRSNGSLDPSFHGTGIVTTSIGSRADVVFAVALQPDGKIVVAGHSDSNSSGSLDFDFAMVRYHHNGNLDMTFNSTGIITTPIGDGDDFGVALAIGPDGKLVMAGANYGVSPAGECAVVRYNDHGSLDSSFNGSGIVTTPCNSGGAYNVAIQPDGKIVVSGRGLALRYNDNGSLDAGFNGTGIINSPIAGHDVAVQFNSKIVMAGFSGSLDSNFAVARYRNNGSPDTTFNKTGIVTTSVGSGSGPSFADDVGTAVALQPDGKIVVTGYSYNKGKAYFTVIRYRGDSPFTFLPIIFKE
jgi:uncharacterized delta-60 repeat protein